MTTRFIIAYGRTTSDGFPTTDGTFKTIFNTIEEAEQFAKENVVRGLILTGDYKIIAKTMDEATFTVTEKIIKKYDYFNEVLRFIYAENDIKSYTDLIIKTEESKKRCRTEKGIEKKNAEIKDYKERIEKALEILKEKK